VKHQSVVVAQPRQTESVANARKIAEEKPLHQKTKQTAPKSEKDITTTNEVLAENGQRF
jgi:hypothetical protein